MARDDDKFGPIEAFLGFVVVVIVLFALVSVLHSCN